MSLQVKEFRETFKKASYLLKPRARTLIEYRESGNFICAPRPLVLEEKAAKGCSGAGKDVLVSIVEVLQGYSGDWTAEALEPVIVKFTEDKGLKLGQVAQPLRGALTGTTASPGIYEVMWLVGKEECIGRMKDVIEGKNEIKAAPKKEEKPKEEKPAKPAAADPNQSEYTKLEVTRQSTRGLQ